VQYSGNRDATTELNLALEAGDPPDIVVIPQPGRIVQFGESGDAVAIPQSVLDNIAGSYDSFWFDLASTGGNVYGVPNKGDVKSLVWYQPSLFAENGYEIPQTWDELEALSEQMKADGIPPWCVGIESGDATGWAFTDWMEDMMLRLQGPDVYDQWVSNEIPFDDPRVVEVAELVGSIWFEEGNVLGVRDLIATTGFREAALPLADGSCGMHRQANLAGSFVPANGAELHPDADVHVLHRRHVLVMDAGPPGAADEAAAVFSGTMARILRLDLSGHDPLMAYVLGLSHALNLAFVTALRGSGERAPQLARISSVTFDRQLRVAAAVVRENPRLYFEIQHANPHGPAAIHQLAAAVSRLAAHIHDDDEAAFVRLMRAGREYLAARD